MPYLRRQGGALINLGSVLSDTAYPLQGHYAASKHAVKGFTDSLRLELEHDGAPISVTLIQPAAIDTPYPEHAKSYLGAEPKHQPPVYAPKIVAKAILACAERPERDVLIGGGAKLFTVIEKLAPRLGDRFKEATAFTAQRSDRPAGPDALHGPRAGDAALRGHYPGHVMESSAYTTMRLNRGKTALALTAVGIGLAMAAGGLPFGRSGDGASRRREM